MNDSASMAKAAITIAPVRKSLRVNTRQARAFEIFTAGLSTI